MPIPTIQLLILDVDGVLTDGGIIRDDNGQQIKRFHVRDGAGIVLWRRLNKDVAIITGKESQVVLHRADELGIENVYQNVGNKLDAYDQLKDELGVKEIVPVRAGLRVGAMWDLHRRALEAASLA